MEAEGNAPRLWISIRFGSSEGIVDVVDVVGAAGFPAGFSCVLAGYDFCLGGRAAVAEAERLVAGFDDVAMMGQAVEQGGGELGVAKDRGPSANVRLVVMMTLVCS